MPENTWDRVERLLGKGAMEQLAQKKVALVGLGSGGGFAALALAMSGVGSFVLIDDDMVAPTNVVRHVADGRHIGQPKVQVVAELIRHRNPAAQVEAVVGRLEDNTARLAGVDLVVVGVDGERVKYTINRICRERNLTAIYAGVYERGEGGDVVIIRPQSQVPTSPCYACWASQLREDLPESQTGETELDYGMIGPEGTLEAEPGLWLHVVRIASAQADMALNELLAGQPMHRTYPANTVILANVAMELFAGMTVPPYSAQWVNVRRDPACMVCGTPPDVAAETALSLDEVAGDMLQAEDDESVEGTD